MFIINNFFAAVAQLINFICTAYMWIVIARAAISWVNADPYNPIVRFLYQATEPLLGRIRRIMPNTGDFDLSPIVLILGVMFLQNFIVPTLVQLGGVPTAPAPMH